jgi:hypothetical protein
MQTLSFLPVLIGLSLLAPTPYAAGQAPTRSEVLAIAQSFAEFRWNATEANVRKGNDRAGIAVHTPTRRDGDAEGDPDHWVAGAENIGVPYKWGGFDSLESFAAGVRKGKAAGDLYTAEKRRKGSAAVSADAVGIDCSGFISRCWKLSRKYGTATLSEVTKPLSSMSERRAGDILNTANAHVILFSEWRDQERKTASFYEAAPSSKVVKREYSIAELQSVGFKPLRYRRIRE